MENNQEDNQDTKNNEEEGGTVCLEDDSHDSNTGYRRPYDEGGKKSFFGKTLASGFLLVSVLLVIGILLNGMTYIKVITYSTRGRQG